MALRKSERVRHVTLSTWLYSSRDTVKVSPDAFVQMAIQLAYYKAHGKCVPTYEVRSHHLSLLLVT